MPPASATEAGGHDQLIVRRLTQGGAVTAYVCFILISYQVVSEFCDLGRHALLDKDDLAALEIVLRSTLDQVQAARKSAQDRPSNPNNLPVADVFAGHGDGLPSIPFPAV